jgi:hypothetical protein
MTSVYAVIAACTPGTVVSRSSTICEIETFITLESSTITTARPQESPEEATAAPGDSTAPALRR